MAAALKKVCKGIKTIAFFAAVLSVRNVCAEPEGVFLHPNDNAYALDKILTRPYLQSLPIREVWRSGAIGDGLAYYLWDYNVPVQNEEIQADAHFWKADAVERDFEFADAKRDTNQGVDFVADFSSSAYPELDAQAVDFIKQIDRADLDVTNMMLDYESKREMVREADKMVDFDQGRTGQALIDLVYSRLNAAEKKADDAVDAALLEKAEEPTDKFAVSGDLSQTETVAAQTKKNYDDLVAGLQNADWADWTTTLDIAGRDDAWWEKAFLGLDTQRNSAKIRKKPENKRPPELIQNAMEGEK